MNKNNRNNYLDIFNKYINNNYKSIPFNVRLSRIGNVKYFPSIYKEWKNSIYVFNHNNLKNLPSDDININSLIKSYFNLYFNNKFFFNKSKSGRSYINKIIVSKPEIKHTSSKAIITLHAYNREKIVLLKKIKSLEKSFYKQIILLFYKGNSICKNVTNNLQRKTIRALLYKELILLRKYKLRLNLNKYKFEEILLYKLNKLISKFYGKNIEFNIINMKSIIFNTDLFTKIAALKLKSRRSNLFGVIGGILNKAIIPKVNRIKEKGVFRKSVNFNLIENKYESMNISYILPSYRGSSLYIEGENNNNNNLDKLLNELYNNSITVNKLEDNYLKIHKTIFNSIKYKNLRGIKLKVKGRLTQRYRADKAVIKTVKKGGLRNIDSSYKGLSSVNIRGYENSNSESSISISKRRIGAFAIKGWIGGK